MYIYREGDREEGKAEGERKEGENGERMER